MRKKLDTRFPAARIKKIMQADEDVGKIALAVPVLVSKALELFLQDLCDRTYEITLQRGAKTMSSLHLKHCVQSYNVFDFLREIVSKVPDYGHSDASAEDRAIPKRRKAIGDEFNESDEESKRSKTHETSHISSSRRGKGRGRGRGRGRGARAAEREPVQHEIESDPCTSVPSSTGVKQNADLDVSEPKQLEKDDITVTDGSSPTVRNFDLNADLDENEAATATAAAAHASSAAPTQAKPIETKHEEYPGWPLSEVDRMAIDPIQFAHINSRLDEEEEDYDEEG